MSVQEGGNLTPYCEPSDVAKYFRVESDGTSDFSFDSNPDAEQVKAMILEQSARIDRHTGHAWRTRTMQNEIHDLQGVYYYWAGTPIKMQKREIRTPLDSSEGDKLEFWDGNQWEDWVASSGYTEGRDGDFWIDTATGMLYVYRRSWWWERYKNIRLTYRYGSENIPADVQMACAKLVAADIMMTDHFGDMLPSGTDQASPAEVGSRLEESAIETLDRRKETRIVSH